MSGGGGCGEIGVSSWRRGREESRPDVIQCNAWLIHGNTVVRGKVTWPPRPFWLVSFVPLVDSCFSVWSWSQVCSIALLRAYWSSRVTLKLVWSEAQTNSKEQWTLDNHKPAQLWSYLLWSYLLYWCSCCQQCLDRRLYNAHHTPIEHVQLHMKLGIFPPAVHDHLSPSRVLSGPCCPSSLSSWRARHVLLNPWGGGERDSLGIAQCHGRRFIYSLDSRFSYLTNPLWTGVHCLGGKHRRLSHTIQYYRDVIATECIGNDIISTSNDVTECSSFTFLWAGAMTLTSRRYNTTSAISMQWTVSCETLQGSKVARKSVREHLGMRQGPTYLPDGLSLLTGCLYKPLCAGLEKRKQTVGVTGMPSHYLRCVARGWDNILILQ